MIYKTIGILVALCTLGCAVAAQHTPAPMSLSEILRVGTGNGAGAEVNSTDTDYHITFVFVNFYSGGDLSDACLGGTSLGYYQVPGFDAIDFPAGGTVTLNPTAAYEMLAHGSSGAIDPTQVSCLYIALYSEESYAFVTASSSSYPAYQETCSGSTCTSTTDPINVIAYAGRH